MYKLYVAEDKNTLFAEKWEYSLGLEANLRGILDALNKTGEKIVSVDTQKNGSVFVITDAPRAPQEFNDRVDRQK